jgi:hypothetical protein
MSRTEVGVHDVLQVVALVESSGATRLGLGIINGIELHDHEEYE